MYWLLIAEFYALTGTYTDCCTFRWSAVFAASLICLCSDAFAPQVQQATVTGCPPCVLPSLQVLGANPFHAFQLLLFDWKVRFLCADFTKAGRSTREGWGLC